MSRKCDLCGKSNQIGHNVSYSKRRTPRVFLPNLRSIKIDNKRIKICMKCLKKMKNEKRVEKVVKVGKVVQVEKVEKIKKAVK